MKFPREAEAPTASVAAKAPAGYNVESRCRFFHFGLRKDRKSARKASAPLWPGAFVAPELVLLLGNICSSTPTSGGLGLVRGGLGSISAAVTCAPRQKCANSKTRWTEDSSWDGSSI